MGQDIFLLHASLYVPIYHMQKANTLMMGGSSGCVMGYISRVGPDLGVFGRFDMAALGTP